MTEQTTLYAFVAMRDRKPSVIFKSTDPAEVKRAWATPEFNHYALRVLRDGEIHHASVAEAQAVYNA